MGTEGVSAVDVVTMTDANNRYELLSVEYLVNYPVILDSNAPEWLALELTTPRRSWVSAQGIDRQNDARSERTLDSLEISLGCRY